MTLLDSGLEKRLCVKQRKASHHTLGSPTSTGLNQSAQVRLIDHEEKHDAYLEWTAMVKICIIYFCVVYISVHGLLLLFLLLALVQLSIEKLNLLNTSF